MGQNITLENACEIALKYYQQKGYTKLGGIRDLGEKWLIAPKRDNAVYGEMNITVNKADGKIADFVLPDTSNFELLRIADSIELPDNYK